MSLGPKIQGTWNIHKAIQGRETELEFFLITSSLAGSVVRRPYTIIFSTTPELT